MKSYTMYADKLNKEYTEAFDQVVTYLSTETIDEVTKDEQLGDLFDLFLTAQTAGRPWICSSPCGTADFPPS